MDTTPETPQQKAAWKAFLASPEFDKLLEEALNDSSPMIELTPEVIAEIRKGRKTE